MTYFLISDSQDTLTGMRMAGVDGVLARTREEAAAAIERAKEDPKIGILIVTEQIATLCEDKLAPLKAASRTPLVVEIPTRRHTGTVSDSISRYIREAVGVKI